MRDRKQVIRLTTIVIVVALLGAGCTASKSVEQRRPDAAARAETTAREVADPIARLVDVVTRYHTQFHRWPTVEAQPGADSAFSLFLITHREEKSFSADFALHASSLAWQLDVLPPKQKDSGYAVEIRAGTPAGKRILRLTGQLEQGGPAMPAEMRTALVQTMTFANLLFPPQSTSHSPVLSAIEDAVLKVGLCMLLRVEPAACGGSRRHLGTK
jgi:hypothetical protein